MASIYDSDRDGIFQRDAVRQQTALIGLAMAAHPAFAVLESAIRTILRRPGVNQGNIYADWLADQLLQLPGGSRLSQ